MSPSTRRYEEGAAATHKALELNDKDWRVWAKALARREGGFPLAHFDGNIDNGACFGYHLPRGVRKGHTCGSALKMLHAGAHLSLRGMNYFGLTLTGLLKIRNCIFWS
jgi:hypothetical protein